MYFLHREAQQSSLSRTTCGIDKWLRQPAAARPDGPAPTVITKCSGIIFESVSHFIGFVIGRLKLSV